ncbi:hypothetical protein KW805_01515 [Candidatus Pacearchaeota archaeon]|nr:hypothetical protein [Candidatus Pacearchaeota archaeon]
MVETLEEEIAEGDLKSILQRSRRQAIFDERAGRNILKKAMDQFLPSKADYDIIKDQAGEFIKDWCSYQLAQVYPYLTNDFFSLKRKIVHGGYPVEIPTIFRFPFESEITPKESDESPKMARVETSYMKHGYAQKLEVKACVPGYPSSVREKYSEAKKICADISLRAFKDPFRRRILEADQSIILPDNTRVCSGTNYDIVWAPTEVEIQEVRPPIDPALILSYNGSHFVVDMWDVPGERPIEGIIREFCGSFLVNDRYKEK